MHLKYSKKSRKSQIKSSSPDTYKTYLAQVELKEPIIVEKLDKLQFINLIKQRTPLEVSQRRADKIRLREVKNIKAKMITTKTLELIIKGPGGLYIKELISGDEGRTIPNVSEVLSTPALCVKLDVLEVED